MIGKSAADMSAKVKLGIVGGKGSGKTYLFRAMAYQATHGGGALSLFVQDAALLDGASDGARWRSVEARGFLAEYESWMRLGTTRRIDERWYRLRMLCRTGVLGRSRCAIDVDHFEGSGEMMEGGATDATMHLWRRAFLSADVLVFCLPLWAVFPSESIGPADQRQRQDLVAGLERIVESLQELRRSERRSQRIRSVLALTMADDMRTRLEDLRALWVARFADRGEFHRARLATASGVMAYLCDSCELSATLAALMTGADSKFLRGLPKMLDFGSGPAWIVPVSAIDGRTLDRSAVHQLAHAERPIPVHVELPLLVAICDATNALA